MKVFRTCTCCKDSKPTRQFSWDGRNQKKTAHCKDCGQFLRLLRKCFMQKPDGYVKRKWVRKAQAKTAYAANDLIYAWSKSA